jgi:hypothetical protein
MPAGVYVLDANVLIEASRRYYAFEIAPGFWKSLVQRVNEGRVVSIDHIEAEIARGNDDLWDWAKQNLAPWFLPTDDDVTIQRYGQIVEWVQSQGQFSEAAKDDFHGGADGWLVAYALSDGCVVVTQETYNADAKRRVPIPNICREFKVPVVDTFKMLRELGVKWE